MAIDITVGTTAGLDYDAFLASTGFLSSLNPNPGMGEFYGTGYTIFSGSQYLLASSPVNSSTTPSEKGVLADGTFNYNFTTHTLGGDLNSLSFGYGPTLNEAGANDYVTLNSGPALTFGNIGATNDTDVHNILYGLINEDATALKGFVDNYAVNFTGNAGDDTFTAFAGNDVVNGKGGSDTLGGGAGNDRFVFDAADPDAVDTVVDFDGASVAGGDTDVLDLTAIAGLTGWAGTTAGGAHTAWYEVVDASTVLLSGDTDGDTVADFNIVLSDYTGGLTGQAGTVGNSFDVYV